MTSTTNPSLPALDIETRDGRVASMRPILPEDKPLLERGLESMSMASRFARFGYGIGHLTDAELRYLTEIDLVEHVAWGVMIDGEPVAVARYVRSPGEECAEFAVAVVDEYQRLGIGRALFQAIVASARHNGIPCLSFKALPSNRAVMRILNSIESHLDEREGLVVGRFRVGDVPPTDGDERFGELLDDYRRMTTDR